jgi:hypothetical protein
VKVGDLVKVNSSCDAGGLVGKRGIVTNIEWKRSWMPMDGPVEENEIARVLIDGGLRLIQTSALDACQ